MSCRRCNRRHHTLLHQPSSFQSDNVKTNQFQTEIETKTAADSVNSEVALTTHFVTGRLTALLATALVQVTDEDGHNTVLRALIDQGSQANFVSERAAQLLKAKRTRIKGTITGVGAAQTTVNHVIRVELRSRYERDFQLSINAYVMPTRLTSHLPSEKFNGSTETWPHLKGLTLADPSFHSPGRVDMLLGVEVCAQILKNEIIKGPPGSPCAQNTSLETFISEETDLESKKPINTYLTRDREENSVYQKMECFKNLPELLQAITYAKRFLKLRQNQPVDMPITTDELENSLQICIRIVQNVKFHEDIRDLREKDRVKNTSRLKTLNPYLDTKMILRSLITQRYS
ncbi:hypothetical protein HF086_015252 [Spodoptera exigua]|uniref:Peptidase aspartic putative domain-containing protein n=1 Tax=Spodoptera exigua TaxID=7107 RepID=A0A922MGI5_SPOEX|nr:hypothetical protein HF086_015252 [Spodoptera exigua]